MAHIQYCKLTLKDGALHCKRAPGIRDLVVDDPQKVEELFYKYNLCLEEGVPVWYEYVYNQKERLIDFIQPADGEDYF